jgi:hypothetical protein
MKKNAQNPNHQGNANQSHNEIVLSLHVEWLLSKWQYQAWQECGEKGTLIHCWWEYKLVQALWKTYGGSSITRNRDTMWSSYPITRNISKGSEIHVKEIPVLACLLQHYSQQYPRYEINWDVQQWMCI